MEDLSTKENIIGGAANEPSRVARFFRTFFFSFVITFVALYGLGLVPQGLRDTPHQMYVWFVDTFSSPEAAIIAALPGGLVPSDGDTRGATSTPIRSGVTSSYDDRGVDWPARTEVHSNEEPVRITVPTAGIDVPIVAPRATDVETLDDALTEGVVLYPSSGYPGERTNMLLFGHSSHLPVVNNPAYKALNNLEYVRLGDDIYIDTGATRYHYRVSAVRLTTADEELIRFDSSRRMVTISTCNTFGKKSERFVVEGIFVGSEHL